MDHGYYVPELPKVEGVVASTSPSCQSKKTVKLKEIQKKKNLTSNTMETVIEHGHYVPEVPLSCQKWKEQWPACRHPIQNIKEGLNSNIITKKDLTYLQKDKSVLSTH